MISEKLVWIWWCFTHHILAPLIFVDTLSIHALHKLFSSYRLCLSTQTLLSPRWFYLFTRIYLCPYRLYSCILTISTSHKLFLFKHTAHGTQRFFLNNLVFQQLLQGYSEYIFTPSDSLNVELVFLFEFIKYSP